MPRSNSRSSRRPRSAAQSRRAGSSSSVAARGVKASVRKRAFENFKDVESLKEDLLALKKKYSEATQANTSSRAKIARLTRQLKRKDDHIQKILDAKVQSMEQTVGDPLLITRVKELKSELLSISSLMHKVRELEASLAAKEEELHQLKSSVKYTTIRELQVEAETYYNEARRYQSLLAQSSPDSSKRRSARGISRATAALESQIRQRNRAADAHGSPSSAAASSGTEQEVRALRVEVQRLRDENKALREHQQSTHGMEEQSHMALMEKLSLLGKQLQDCQHHVTFSREQRNQQDLILQSFYSSSPRDTQQHQHQQQTQQQQDQQQQEQPSAVLTPAQANDSQSAQDAT